MTKKNGSMYAALDETLSAMSAGRFHYPAVVRFGTRFLVVLRDVRPFTMKDEALVHVEGSVSVKSIRGRGRSYSSDFSLDFPASCLLGDLFATVFRGLNEMTDCSPIPGYELLPFDDVG